MIRIRFPRDVAPPAWLDPPPLGVEVTTDPRVIALETEKNGPEQFAAVERTLRPMFQHLWRSGTVPFRVVLVETQSGCNYSCEFCPVAKAIDPRPFGQLDITLIRKIATELGAFGYDRTIALFANNEPLLDPRLEEIISIFRSSCQNAHIRVLTNGILASRERVTSLFNAGLSLLIVNNYTDGRRLIGPTRDLISAAKDFLPFDIRISVRDRRQVLTTRAGLAPNRSPLTAPMRGFCALPFTDIVVSHTGLINLCGFDAYGQVVIGDVRTSSLVGAWTSEPFTRYRQSLLLGVRKGLQLCEKCDFDGFRDPFGQEKIMTRGDLTKHDQKNP